MTANTWNWIGAYGQGWDQSANGVTAVWSPVLTTTATGPNGGDTYNIVAGQAASVVTVGSGANDSVLLSNNTIFNRGQILIDSSQAAGGYAGITIQYTCFIAVNSADAGLPGDILMSDNSHNFIGHDGGGTPSTFVNNDNLISGAGNITLQTYVNGYDLKGTAAVDATGLNAMIISATVDNFGILESTNPNNYASVGGLVLSNATIDQTTTNHALLGSPTAYLTPTGIIKADGAHTHVDLGTSTTGATIEGGELLALNGGVFNVYNGGLDGSLNDGNNVNAPINIMAGTNIDIVGGGGLALKGIINNLGAINLQSTGNAATSQLTINGPVTLKGGGMVTLSDQNFNDNVITDNGYSQTLDNIDNTIVGSGKIVNGYAAPLTIINEIGGTIEANGANALSLQATVLNHGLIESVNSNVLASLGGLQILGTVDQRASATAPAGNISVVLPGAHVDLGNPTTGGTVIGGTLTSAGRAVVNVYNGLLDGSQKDGNGAAAPVNIIHGTNVDVVGGGTLSLNGIINNAGAINLQSTGNAAPAALIMTGTVTLKGGGVVTLSNQNLNDNVIGDNGYSQTLDNIDNTIVGSGKIVNGYAAPLTIINEVGGTLEANQSNPLDIQSTLNNLGLLEANGGNLILDTAPTGSGHALITNGGTLTANGAFNENVTFSGAGTLQLSQAYGKKISGFGAGDTVAISGVGNLTGSGSGAPAFKLSVSGNVVTQSFVDGSGALWTFNINGQNYKTTVQSFDTTGNLTSIDYKGVTGSAYNEFQYFYTGTNATGYTSTGLDLYYSGQASGLTEVDLDGSGNLTRALYAFAGTAPGSQTGFEADYVAGEAAGSSAAYLAPAGAAYSTFVVEFDNANNYVGAVYTAISTGKTYNETQSSYTAGSQPKLTETTLSQYTGTGGPSVVSFFNDNTGAVSASQYTYTNISTQAYTSDVLLYNASNVLVAAQYSGYTTKPFTSQTTFYNASGVAQQVVRDFTGLTAAGSINGQAYDSFERIFNPAFTLLATAYHLDNGGNVYVGVASNVSSPTFGGTGVSANATELSNTLTGGDWTITGGGTGETFNFASFFNKAEITDYGAAFGGATDVISVSTQDFADWATMLADAAPSGGGANTTFTSTKTGDKLTLDGVTVSQLQLLTPSQANADFLFHA